MKITQAIIKISWKERWRGGNAAHLLRGAIAKAFPDDDLFHQHSSNGKLIYRYPRLHYRWEREKGVIVAFGEGLEPLSELLAEDLELRLGNCQLYIAESVCEFRCHEIKVLNELVEYYFHSPYLPFSQENFKKYHALSKAERRKERNRILVGNILSSCRELGAVFDERIYADLRVSRSLECEYKGRLLQGFRGAFVTNVELPEDFAVGKAVSHGYGWVKRKI